MLKLLLIAILLITSAHADKAAMVAKVLHLFTHTPKKPRNYTLAGKKHPRTGVRFSQKADPLFKKCATCNMRLSWYDIQFDRLSSDASIRNKHFAICSKQLYKKVLKDSKLLAKFSRHQIRQLRKGKTPDGYTWHHTSKKNILTLVDRDIHAKTGHSGGFYAFH